jgi:hypothetical protein
MTGGGYKFATMGYDEIMAFIEKNTAKASHIIF